MAVCNSQSFIHQNPSRLIIKNSLPMVSAILVLLVYDLLESSLLANQTQEVLTAFGFTLPITAAMTALAIGLSIRTNNKVIRQNCLDKQQVSVEISGSLIKSISIVLLCSVVFWLCQPQLLQLTGNTQDVSQLANHVIAEQQSSYLDLRFLGWVFLAIIWLVNAVLRALGWMTTASGLMFSWASIKCLLAIFLLSPSSAYSFSLPLVAWVHIITDVFFALLSLYILHKKVGLQADNFPMIFTRKIKTSKDSVLIVFQQFITPISMASLTYIAASIDTSYVAALALLFRIEVLFLLLPMVLTTSLPALVGANYWHGQHTRVTQFYVISFSFIMLFQLVLALVFLNQHYLLSHFICSLDAVAKHLVAFLTWVPWTYGAAGIIMVFQSCLNAQGKTLSATILAASHKLVFLLLFALLGTVIWDKSGFYIGLALGHVAALTVVFILLKQANIKLSFRQLKSNDLNHKVAMTKEHEANSP